MNLLSTLNESFVTSKKTFLGKFDNEEQIERFNNYYTLEISWMNTLLLENKDLQTCDPLSLKKVLQNVVTAGLTLSPALKECYVIKRGNFATLEISYMGLIKLLTDAGTISKIESHVIYENDYHEYELGLNPNLVHKPVLFNRGRIIAVYAVAYMRDGAKQYEMLSLDDIEEIKSASPSANSPSSPWKKFPSQMFRKSAIKRLFKYLPKTNLSDELIAALSIEHANDINYVELESQEKEREQIFEIKAPKKETKKAPKKEIKKETPEDKTPETKIVDHAKEIIKEKKVSPPVEDDPKPKNGSSQNLDKNVRHNIQISKDNKNIFGNNGDELGNFLNLLK